MAQADGYIIIDTEIKADGMKAGSKEVEAAVRRMASTVDGLGNKAKIALNKQVNAFSKLNQEYAAQERKVEELKRKVSEYANQKIPTEEYKAIQDQIDKAIKKLNALQQAQDRFEATGGRRNTTSLKKMEYDIEELTNEIKYAEAELKDLEETGKAFTLGTDTKEATADMERLAEAEQKLLNMNNRLGSSYASIKNNVDEYGKKLLGIDSAHKKAGDSSRKFSDSLRSTGNSVKSANFVLKRMLGTSLLFSFVFRAISSVVNAVKSGFSNLAQYSGETNSSISMLWGSLETLKNSLATAFAPILSVVAPILSKFIDMLSTAASYVSMFFSFLSGKSTYTKAIAVQKDYAGSLKDTASGAKDAAEGTKEAAEAAEDYLSPLDDINRMDKSNSNDGSGSSGGNGAGAGGGAGSGPLFTEEQITNIPALEKLKDILSKIFQPFKEAWEKEGKNTIDAAKYAFSELESLAESVGKSMLEVWTNGTGTKILITMLQIAQGVLITIGNIARQLDEAWNKNQVGTAIVQALANAFQTVLDIINQLVLATADWSGKLDFYPLLESIKNLFESMSPLIQSIGNFILEIYTTIILPVLKWLIEYALPTVINILADLFNFLGEHQWIVDAIGAALLGAFAASKIVPLITTIIGAISGLITIIGSGGLSGLLSTLVGFLGGPLTLAITTVIAILVLLVTHWDEVKSVMGKFNDWLQGAFHHDWTKEFGYLGEYVNAWFANIQNIWNGVKGVFNGIITFLKGVFTGNWRQIWEGVKQIFQGVWNTFAGIVKSPINLIIGFINALLYAVQVMQNGIASALNSLNIRMPKWVEKLTGYSSIGFNIVYRSTPRIPYLAQGAVIPPNKEFMAVLGDQKSGNNIEAPEDLIRKIVREEAGNSGKGTTRVQAQINRRTIFDIVIDEAKARQTMTGKNPFEMA